MNLVFLFLILQFFSVTKHVEIYLPFEFRFISNNKDQLVDIMTKVPSSPRFIFLCVKLKLSLWEPLTWRGMRDLPNLICCIFIFVGTFEYCHLFIFIFYLVSLTIILYIQHSTDLSEWSIHPNHRVLRLVTFAFFLQGLVFGPNPFIYS